MKGIIKGLIAVVIGFGLTLTSANAADCKGMSASACSSSSSCNWVKGYKRKDGATVAAHCRTAKGKSTLEKKAKSKKDAATSKGKSAKADMTDKAKSKKDKAKSSMSDKKTQMKDKAKSKKDAAKAKKAKLKKEAEKAKN